jgi:hypothetical protein
VIKDEAMSHTADDDDDTPDFDPSRFVADYRRIIELRDSATDRPRREECDRIAGILRDTWKRWRGEDCLHEMAYGEPQG